MLLVACSASDAGDKIAANPVRRVLVIYSDERLLPANVIVDEAIRGTFAAETTARVEFHSEFLDVARFPGKAQQQRERDFLREKYRERPPDLVIAGGGPSLEFLLQYRAAIFPDVPIVHCGWRLCRRRFRTQIAGIRCSELPPPPWSWLSACNQTLGMLRW
jgi:hypothetical protein